MFIVNKETALIINADSIIEMRGINRENGSSYIRTDLVNGKGVDLMTYEINDDAHIAVKILIDKIIADRGSAAVCVPTQEEVTKKRQDSAYIKPLHLTGRKSKGHGGS